MAKIKIEIELEYDADLMYGIDKDAKDWFFNHILKGREGELILHSNDMGDTIGDVCVIKIESIT